MDSKAKIRTDFLEYLSNNTPFDKKRLRRIVDAIPIEIHNKGDILLRQGDSSQLCFFVVKGCLRQYFCNEKAVEQTVDFFTEGQFFAGFESTNRDETSKYFFSCAEDSALIVGNDENETEMYDEFPELKNINLLLLEGKCKKTQQIFASFKTSTPEDRYQSLLDSRPELLTRVPQHQIASYLGITPESLSRIKKRLTSDGRSGN